MNVTIDTASGTRKVKLYIKEMNALTKARGIIAALAGMQEPNSAEALGAMDKLIAGLTVAPAADTPLLGTSDPDVKVPPTLPGMDAAPPKSAAMGAF